MKKKVMAVASIGGHWVQLLRIARPLEEYFEMVYVSTHQKCATMVEGQPFFKTEDFSRTDVWKHVLSFFKTIRLVWQEEPDTIMTTGAAPGLVFLFVGWILRRKTIWIDSIANAEHLSLSGRLASKIASRTYTQWEDLANGNIIYAGNILGKAMVSDTSPNKKETEVTTPESTDKESASGIFVTIGTQLPFDRLIRIVDEVAPELNEDVVAQVSQCGFVPKNIKAVDFIAPDEFNKIFDKASLIVSHAGMGSILSALQKNKPIIIFPRIAALGEHRNEHQLATARKFKEQGSVYVAMDEEELKNLLRKGHLKPLQRIGNFASTSLIHSIQTFIENRTDSKS